MFARIVVGVDGAAGGLDAVALARRLAGPGGTIVLVNAYPFDPVSGRGRAVAYEAVLHEDARARLAAIEAGEQVERLTVPDLSPARALHRAAESERADVVVIGSCHRGPVGRLLLGDVSRATLHGAPCPVAVAPRGYAAHQHPIRVVGVGYNSTPESRCALDLAAGLTAELGGELRVRTAVTAPVPFAPAYAYTFDFDAFAEEHRETAQRELDEAVGKLGVAVSTDLSTDPPGRALEQLSEQVDLLVVGSRGWGAARQVVLGSTSDRLAHHSRCPVLLVPAPAEQPEPVPAAMTGGAIA